MDRVGDVEPVLGVGGAGPFPERMIISVMNDKLRAGDLEGVLGKLSFLSRVLGEVDDWLETGRAARGPDDPAPGARILSLSTLDLYLDRERPRS